MSKSLRLPEGWQYTSLKHAERQPNPVDAVFRAARHNAMVAAALDAWRAGSFPSFEAALAELVVHLVSQNEILQRKVQVSAATVIYYTPPEVVPADPESPLPAAAPEGGCTCTTQTLMASGCQCGGG